jgi:hypothetical protein
VFDVPTQAIQCTEKCFRVQAFCINDAPASPGDQFEWVTPIGVSNRQVDFGNGTYLLCFTPSDQTDPVIEIDVNVNGQPLKGSPVIVQVQNSGGVASKSNASGTGLNGGKTNQDRRIIVDVRDSCDKATIGNDNVTILAETLDGDIVIRPNSTFRGNGQYETTFRVSKAGKYRVFVMVNGENIAGSPFDTKFSESKMAVWVIVVVIFAILFLLIIALLCYFRYRRRVPPHDDYHAVGDA